MNDRSLPRVLTVEPGVAFLPALADALVEGRLVEGFRFDGDPLTLASVTIYVPTRRAARELRGVFMDRIGKGSVILPTIKPLGEFDEDAALFEPDGVWSVELDPPISATDRLLLLAPLVRRWKQRLPAHVAALFDEEVTVPASFSDAIWLARDLAGLMDEVETEGADWTRLVDLVPGELAQWWQVTLDFLEIVTRAWPQLLAERRLSNPAAHRSALIRAETARLKAMPPQGPVIAGGSTGSIPATAELLASIARLADGAVVLPGLDLGMDDRSWAALTAASPEPAILGHPQYGLAKLLRTIAVERRDVATLARSEPELALRTALVGEAFRPAGTTDEWADRRAAWTDAAMQSACAGVTLVDAANERDEAAAIAIALRQAVDQPGRTAALVTGDRELARRVSSELLRFGIPADDSGGTPLAATPAAALLRLMVRAVFEPGDPVPVLGLLKHPLLALGMDRAAVRRAAGTIELVALRGGVGRPDVADLADFLEARLRFWTDQRHKPFWLSRMTGGRLEEARAVLARLATALEPLAGLVSGDELDLRDIVRATVLALEGLARGGDGGLDELYKGDAGDKLAEFLRALVSSVAPFPLAPLEWPDVLEALLAPEVVKPAPRSDARVSIWGALEARLLSPDTLVVGGLNEGTWPRKPQSDRFMSRVMKTGIDLEPPERRIGQSAHDVQMAMGANRVILTRAARSGDAPAIASRWLQRFVTFAGKADTDAMRARGGVFIDWARALDATPGVRTPFPRPEPKPPLALRPKHFSVTEIETLRRDPYAIHARKILRLSPLDPLVRDPGAAERGTLFHEILHRFSRDCPDPKAPEAFAALVAIGRTCFEEADLPGEVFAVWWPRFEKLADGIVRWERERANAVLSRHAEMQAKATSVGASEVTLSGYADRVDLLPGDLADIIDYKTGTSPSKRQAHRLVSPQLALEGALLMRKAFGELGAREPADLAFVRLKANGEVEHESILSMRGSDRSARDLSEEAWARLESLLDHYSKAANGYKSRALPFREGDTDGDYDHLARVLEWSAGGDGDVPAGDDA